MFDFDSEEQKSILLGIFIGALIAFVLFASISKGRFFTIFTEGQYKCGAAKLMGDNPNITSFYSDQVEAGAMMHNCHEPKSYVYKDRTFTLESDGKYRAPA
jgi:hypothetical protein